MKIGKTVLVPVTKDLDKQINQKIADLQDKYKCIHLLSTSKGILMCFEPLVENHQGYTRKQLYEAQTGSEQVSQGDVSKLNQNLSNNQKATYKQIHYLKTLMKNCDDPDLTSGVNLSKLSKYEAGQLIGLLKKHQSNNYQNQSKDNYQEPKFNMNDLNSMNFNE